MHVTALLLVLLRSGFAGCTNGSLSVFPNRSQFFKYESFTLSCDEDENSVRWKVKANTKRGLSECGANWGTVRTSSCVVNELYVWSSGIYWCESTSGKKSTTANITVTEGSVILEIPLFPVMEGDSLTLRCSSQSNSSNLRASIFVKDRSAVGAAITGQMTIPAVKKSDEGFYMCIVTDLGASTESWLAVKGSDPDPAPAHFLGVSRLICHLVVGAPYFLSTIMLGLVYRDRTKARRAGEKTSCDDVVMEEAL